ncbi:MAG: bifunctional demethylmenaquinone methyltransferase/2-methoxy-6-polyprenyl-1,4-benzoquinol methylase UbiE [Planctomycetota bacterium]
MGAVMTSAAERPGRTPPPAGDGARVDKSGSRVRGMFAEIAPRYDLVNRLLSGGIDVRWRRETVRRAPPPSAGGAILDVCTGTGDLAIAYADRAGAAEAAGGPPTRIVASDFCAPMLDRGRDKARARHPQVEWVEADAMALPFPDASFDLVTVAFGLRNIADTSRGLGEMARVCRPGGTLAILEFSLPESAALRSGYLWYFRNVLPRLGNAVARNASDAYTYLNRSVEAFPSGEALAELVRRAGFRDVVQHPLTLGIAALSLAERCGRKPAGGRP